MNITGHTQIVGVIGDPITHTRSPAMHNAAFTALGMDWVYVPFHVRAADLGDAVRGFRATGIRGINATIPHKEPLVSLVDSLSAEAEFIGAVNTLVFERDGSIHGDNTDARGFLASLFEGGMPAPRNERVVVLGAGGAARAVVAALVDAGVKEIVIANRTPARAERLAEEISARTRVHSRVVPLADDALMRVLRESALLVNTTSAGMVGKEPLTLRGDLLYPPLAVCDVVYTPPETPLLKAAAANGCRVLNGVGMLMHQGAIAFERWTGVAPPVEVMRTALRASL
jgi:shikimate dehydrogenase